MATQNNPQNVTDNLPVLLIGLASLICLILNRGGAFAYGEIIVGVVLIWLLRAYRGNICDTKQGRLIYSAFWAASFLIATSFLLPWLTNVVPPLSYELNYTVFRLNDANFLALVIWLVTLFVCKAIFGRKASASAASNSAGSAPAVHS